MAVLMDEKKKLAESLFAWAKSEQGWALIRSALTKFPDLAQETGGRWGEGLLHWAALGNLAAVYDLLSHGANINQHDLEGRKAIDWAVEKAYFMCVEPPEEMSSVNIYKARTEAEACAIALSQNGAELAGAAEAKEEGYSLVELALRSGLPALCEEFLKEGRPKKTAEDLWTWWLIGKWDKGQGDNVLQDILAARVAIEKANDQLLSDFRTGSGDPLGLLAVKLYLQGHISLDALALVHKAGARIDEENTAGEGFEELCAEVENAAQVQSKIEDACFADEA